MTLASFDGDKIKSLLTDLKAEATGFVRNCDAEAEILSEFKVYMRYSGQGWEIPIMLTEEQAMNPNVNVFEARFIENYTKLFGRPVEGMDIEITVWSVNAKTPPEVVDQDAGSSSADIHAERQVFDPAVAEYVKASVVLRDSMKSGAMVAGPAVITEDETTIIIPSSRSAVRQPDGCIDLKAKG